MWRACSRSSDDDSDSSNDGNESEGLPEVLRRRLGFYLFTAWAAVTINFFIPRLIPGDPVDSLIAEYQGR